MTYIDVIKKTQNKRKSYIDTQFLYFEVSQLISSRL